MAHGEPLALFALPGGLQASVREQRVQWLAHARVRSGLDPHGHGIPPVRPRAGGRLLVRDDTMHERCWGVRVGALQQKTLIMAEQPSVEGLHPDEVGHDDVLVSDV